jgi:hypothetical protein
MADKDNQATVPDDVINVLVEIDAPGEIGIRAKEFEKSAIPGRQGSTRTLLVGEPEHGSALHAQKNGALGKWIVEGGMGESFGRFTNIKTVKSELAHSLAAMQASTDLITNKIERYRLQKADLIQADIGETDRVIVFNDSSARDVPEGRVLAQAQIPTPVEFKARVKEFAENAKINEDSEEVYVGDHVSGFIHASKNKKGKWDCIGEGDVDYQRKFEGDLTVNEVAKELAQDLTALTISEDTISDHIRRHGIKKENLLEVEVGGTNGYTISYNDDEPDAPEIG